MGVNLSQAFLELELLLQVLNSKEGMAGEEAIWAGRSQKKKGDYSFELQTHVYLVEFQKN